MPFDKSTSTDEAETQPGLDIDAATAEISSDLFGQGEDEEQDDEAQVEGEQEGVSSPPGTVETPSAPQPDEETAASELEGQENSQEVQEVGAPKTWTKEGLAEWASIPPRAQQEILKREEDYFRGISMYKGAAEYGQRYADVVQPYAPLLASQGVDPVQLFQSFSANHYLLSYGSPEQKLAIAANLVQHYGIPLQALVEHIGEQAIAPPPDPAVVALQRELGELRNSIQQAANADREQIQGQIQTTVDTFASDGQHPYFDEVAEDMARFVESGLATSLQDAYERAVFSNPVTRQKEIDRLAAEKVSVADTAAKNRKDKVARSTAADVTTRPHNRSGTTPVGTMDDTLEKTMSDINSRS